MTFNQVVAGSSPASLMKKHAETCFFHILEERILGRSMLTADEKFMKKALHQARRAAAIGEIPIGCVIVCDGKIIARGFNERLHRHSTLAHAEITAIDRASRKLGDWRLEGCTMYVTLEPCQMCAGALVQSRIDRVVIGAMNPKAGCAGSLLNILQMPQFNHQVEITCGVLEEECSALLSDFFVGLRKRLKEEKAGGAPQEPLK